MKRLLLILIISGLGFTFAQPQFSEINSTPGAFNRMGFGARGIGMGNALSAVTTGNLVAYYNPAVSVFQQKNSFQTSYSFLSLDRSLNFVNFTRRFDFYSSKDTSENRKPRNSAGISLGVINAGVSGIDGRDNQGIKTGELSTSENQFFLSVANRFSEKFAIGIAVKFYFYDLYEEVTSSGLGLDVGAVYKFNENFSLGFVIAEINSKYEWDTGPVYGQNGITTEDSFPNLRKIGASYHLPEMGLLLGLEFENSNAESNIIRFGVEYNLIDNLYLRGGLDQFNLSNSDFPIKPAAGFSYSDDFGGLIIGVDYAFVVEQYSSQDRHIVGVNLLF